jgi:hypothetical protein
MLNTISGLLGDGAGVATSYESISTTTVGAGGALSVTFSSIPSTYTHLQIRGFNRDTTVISGSQVLTVQFNGDTAANYSLHRLTADGATAAAAGSASTSNFVVGTTIANVANTFGTFVLDILDYKDTNKYKTARTLEGSDANGTGIVALRSGSWRSTSAITSISLTPTGTGIAQYSSFALYGIK